MVDNVIDRGGSVGPDPVVADAPGTVVARSGGWGTIAFMGAGIGLVSAIGGIAIGYSAFHRPAAATSAAQPGDPRWLGVARRARAGQCGADDAGQADRGLHQAGRQRRISDRVVGAAGRRTRPGRRPSRRGTRLRLDHGPQGVGRKAAPPGARTSKLFEHLVTTQNKDSLSAAA